MAPRVYQVDAFTDRPFAGNPAGVCLLDGPADDAWMQALAAEENLPETAFLHPTDEAAGTWSLRWFTPTVEVDLCGHATLASAHVLTAETGVDHDTLAFDTRSGRLTATAGPDGIALDFPAIPAGPLDDAGLAGALAAAVPGAGGADRLFRAANHMVVAVLDDAGAVRSCSPDLAAVGALDVAAVIVTAAGGGSAGGDGPDVVSRVFAPALGIDEDPVTGAAHCVLAPFWAARLGRSRLRAHQASARGGDLVIEDRGERVGLVGRAVTVLVSTLAPAAGP